MKRLVFTLLILVFAAGCAPKLTDLSHAKLLVKEYYEKGEYDREMDEIAQKAIEKLQNEEFGVNSGAFFDVDETALANYPHIKSVDFGSVSKLWDEWVFSAKAKAIPQVKKIYDFLVSRGVKIYFITGRDAKFYEATRQNLINEGYTKFEALICRGAGEKNIDAVTYKSAHRAKITAAGIKIIANVGDQKSDSEGGNSGYIIRLPNYLYVID